MEVGMEGGGRWWCYRGDTCESAWLKASRAPKDLSDLPPTPLNVDLRSPMLSCPVVSLSSIWKRKA